MAAQKIVYVREVWVQAYTVEASTDQEAIEMVKEDDCLPVDDSFEYSHVLDSSLWTVEDA